MLKQLRRQAAKRQKSSIELIGVRTSTPIADLVPPFNTEQPANLKKRGCLARAPQPRTEVGFSSHLPSVLGDNLQLA